MTWVAIAWDKVKDSTIQKCFVNAGFNLTNEPIAEIEETCNILEVYNESTIHNYSEFLSINEEIITNCIDFDII